MFFLDAIPLNLEYPNLALILVYFFLIPLGGLQLLLARPELNFFERQNLERWIILVDYSCSTNVCGNLRLTIDKIHCRLAIARNLPIARTKAINKR